MTLDNNSLPFFKEDRAAIFVIYFSNKGPTILV